MNNRYKTVFRNLFCHLPILTVLAALTLINTLAATAGTAAIQETPLSPLPSPIESPTPVRIGVLAHKGVEVCKNMWQPTMDLLNKEIPNRQFTLVPLTFEEIEPAVTNESIDFLICNPAIYVNMEVRYGVARILTLRNRVGTQIVSEFGGVIFCRADRSDLQTIQDIRGKHLAATDQTSFGGWLISLREINAVGINPKKDCASLNFLGEHQAVVRSVLARKADVGIVRTDTLERMASAGELDIATLRIIPVNVEPEKQADFPYVHSTRLYPEWPMSKLHNTSEDLASTVAVALLHMPADSPAAIAAQSGGWGICLNYTSVHECLRELNVPPYENYGRIGIKDMCRQHWVGVTAIVLLISALITALLLLRNKQHAVLRISNWNRLILDSAGEGICGVNAQGITTFINPMAEQLLGYSSNELLGNSLHALTHHTRPDGSPYPQQECPILLSIRDGVVHQGDDEFMIRKDGTGFPVTYSSRPIITEEKIIGAVICFRDNTEVKKVEEQLRQLSRAVEQSPVAIVTTNPAGDIEYVNPKFIEVTGYTLEEVLGKNPRVLKSGDKSSEVYRELWTTIVSGKEWHGEFHNKKKNGELFWESASISPIRDSTGRVTHYIAIKEDITERKRTDEALRESESRLRAITDSAQDAVLMMDPKGKISYWNPAAERIFGYTREEAIGQILHTYIVPKRYQEAHNAAFPLFQQTGKGSVVGTTLDLNAIRKDGQEIAIQLSLSAIQIEGKWHAVGLLRDITDRKRAEAELIETNLNLEIATARANEMAIQAELANIAKSEFLANMSHEIRTPMNSVIGMTGLLLDTELTPEQRQYAQLVRSSGEALLGILNDILDFSKIEARKLSLEVLDFDLRSTLEDTAELLAVKAQEKGLDLVCMIDPEVPVHLRGDPGRLRQIIINLGGNAVKFTHHGGVTLHTSLESQTDQQATLRISIHDTGIGIPPDKKELLFTPFTQADSSTTRKYGGTGLGLTISKQLVEMMGGHIDVESEVGQGTTFWFTAVFEKQALTHPTPPVLLADLTGVRVLVVDDHDTNRLLVTTLLKNWGCRYGEAAEGETALERLNEAFNAGDPYRVALLDMLMPGMDGAELGSRIKENENLRETQLIMMTSLAERGDAARLTALGFAGYLTKPLRQSQFRECLAMVLGRSGVSAAKAPSGLITRHTVSEAQKQRARILLAEDNVTNQLVAVKILERLGYRADVVANGLEVLSALKNIPYDLVLMDVQMPEMDGFQATQKIRSPHSEVRNHQIPIIAMTAHAMQGDRERCLDAGMNDYVTKPISRQALADALAKWLPCEINPQPLPQGEQGQLFPT